MVDIALTVQNLGKEYLIGGPSSGAPSMLREVIANALRHPLRGLTRRRTPNVPVWALRHVSFEVERGQIVGIIGPNGAGKSTLLKILSRITAPTEGRVEIRGRVASLLEVGTGFHPELTGRENIYMSGTFLGMRKAEIDAKLEEIIAFSEIAKFMDTPVKHYSSGMYVRLAFAVAAHLDPDILIVDEVLAVGDAAFQRKCLAKMEDVRHHGRTVLLVSHNMSAVTRLCQRALLISGGTLVQDGPASEVATTYLLTNLRVPAQREWTDGTEAPGNDVVRLRAMRVVGATGAMVEAADIRRPVGIEMTYEVLKPGYCLVPKYEIFNDTGTCLFSSFDVQSGWRSRIHDLGTFSTVAWIPGNLLAEGTVLVTASVFSPEPQRTHFRQRDAVAFQVVDSLEPDTARGGWEGKVDGAVRPLLEWTTTRRDGGEGPRAQD